MLPNNSNTIIKIMPYIILEVVILNSRALGHISAKFQLEQSSNRGRHTSVRSSWRELKHGFAVGTWTDGGFEASLWRKVWRMRCFSSSFGQLG